MKVLGVDTSSKNGSVALLDGFKVTDEIISRQSVSFSRSLLVMIEKLLSKHNVSPHELSAIAIASGPGSFTGIRIGLATVQGMALSLGLPVYGVSTLEAMACVAKPTANSFVAMIDAGKEYVFFARFGQRNGHPVRETADAYTPLQSALQNGGTVYCGEGAETYRGKIETGGGVFDEEFLLNSIAAGAGISVSSKIKAGDVGKIGELKPNYIRRSSAEITREKLEEKKMDSSLKEHPKFATLYEKDNDFRKLSDEHMELKREAAGLSKMRFMSSDEEQKMNDIKKRKLEIKDKLHTMLQDHSA